jgi:cytochrome c peroxidase
MYRTAPLAGLWAHQKRGFYHDGRFATLQNVIEHYDSFFKLKLTDQEKRDLSEYLCCNEAKSLRLIENEP